MNIPCLGTLSGPNLGFAGICVFVAIFNIHTTSCRPCFLYSSRTVMDGSLSLPLCASMAGAVLSDSSMGTFFSLYISFLVCGGGAAVAKTVTM